MSTLPFARPHSQEPHVGELSDRLNWLRAGVLGANDGLVSTAGIVVGVAGGEYVSVSTQRDTEQAAVSLEKRELATMPEREEDELTGLYQERGLSEATARQVARELTEHNALQAHAEAELHIDPDQLTSPWQAAGASFLAFAVGGLLPFLAIMYPDASLRVWVCVVAVVIGLVLTGYLSARLGKAPTRPAIIRNLVMGILTMAITWGVGRLFGVATG